MHQLVDQLLFGYRNGHELIAGSRPLSPTQLRDVLPHVDANIDHAEDRQLIGAWVPSLERYLIARIWPAPERPRQGAVWAHALLLDAVQLRDGALTGLPGLLHRPADGASLDPYLARLPWPAPVEPRAAPQPLVRALVWAAFDSDQRPALVLWDEPSAGEELLIALLDAMPAMARPGLSFRTRAQARADSYRLVLARDSSGTPPEAGACVLDARRAPPMTPPSWTHFLDPTAAAARLRAFAQRYGRRDAFTGAQVLALVAIAQMVEAGNEPAAVVEVLMDAFPGPDEVPELRAALLGAAGSADPLWGLGEEQRLALVLEHPMHFDVVTLAVSERLAALTGSDPLGVLRLVEHGRAFIARATRSRLP